MQKATKEFCSANPAAALAHVRAIPAMLAQLDIVDMRRHPDLEHEHQLMLRAIETAHAAIGLCPDAKVLEFGIAVARSGQDLAHMPPVHADEVDRAIGRRGDKVVKTSPRNAVNSPSDISPDAMANSRCLTAPSPVT